MEYNKTNWQNFPSTSTPLNATNLNKIEDQLEILTNAIYPVGSIYISANNVNPSTLFGGTWEQIQDKFLLSAGSTYSAGDTGGSATHNLSVNQLPSHSHDGIFWGSTNGRAFVYTSTSGSNQVFDLADPGVSSVNADYNNSNHIVTGNTGAGASINHMPPYLVVYVWKRTA